MKRHTTVEDYIEGLERYQPEVCRLREILGSTPLVEEVKWGSPAYTHSGKIVVVVAAFKEHFSLWFHQGALLNDEAGHLADTGDSKAQAMRQWRMKTGKDIRVRAIKAYVKEAIALVDEGKEIKPRRGRPVVVPPELGAALQSDKAAKRAFDAMPPGKRREYAEHVADAKRADTKAKRVTKILPMIKKGGGLHDKYRSG